jgi:hypothetical protein
MKSFLKSYVDHTQFSLLLCSVFNLFMVMLAISLGQGEALANSIRGWHGGEVLTVMFGLPLAWGFISAVLDSGINKLNQL